MYTCTVHRLFRVVQTSRGVGVRVVYVCSLCGGNADHVKPGTPVEKAAGDPPPVEEDNGNTRPAQPDEATAVVKWYLARAKMEGEEIGNVQQFELTNVHQLPIEPSFVRADDGGLVVYLSKRTVTGEELDLPFAPPGIQAWALGFAQPRILLRTENAVDKPAAIVVRDAPKLA